MPLALVKFCAFISSLTLSLCQLPSVPPKKMLPLTMLPPSFGIMLVRSPPDWISAGCALVDTVTSALSASLM